MSSFIDFYKQVMFSHGKHLENKQKKKKIFADGCSRFLCFPPETSSCLL